MLEVGLAQGRSMIPPFNDDGYLPPGIHSAPLEEIAARFGQESELRRVQMEAVQWLVELARRAGMQRIVVNGSFVTDKLEPNDVDCVLLIGPGFPNDPGAEAELVAGLPFINLELVDLDAFRQLTERTFATDRNLVPKGMVEVSL
jgi:hypothetical protein